MQNWQGLYRVWQAFKYNVCLFVCLFTLCTCGPCRSGRVYRYYLIMYCTLYTDCTVLYCTVQSVYRHYLIMYCTLTALYCTGPHQEIQECARPHCSYYSKNRVPQVLYCTLNCTILYIKNKGIEGLHVKCSLQEGSGYEGSGEIEE